MKCKKNCITRYGISMVGIPAMLLTFCMYVLPMIITVLYSLLDNTFSRTYIGIANYIHTWNNQYFQLALKNTIILTLLLVSSSFFLTLWLVYLLQQISIKATIGLAMLIIPLLIPSATAVTLWRAAFKTSSFSGTFQSYIAIISLFLWKYSGAGTFLLYSGLHRIQLDILDAAALDGAGSVKSYIYVCIPILQKEITMIVLFYLMNAFRIYKESYLLFGEYPSSTMYLVQHYLSNHFLKMNFQYVASGAVSFGIFALIMYVVALLLLYSRGRKRL